MKGVLAYLLFISYNILIRQWRRGRGTRATSALAAALA